MWIRLWAKQTNLNFIWRNKWYYSDRILIFYTELVGDLQENLPKASNKFTSKASKHSLCQDFMQHNWLHGIFPFIQDRSEEVIKKKLLSLCTNKPLFFTFKNVINLSIKRSSLQEECKMAQLKVQGSILKGTNLFHFFY